MIKKMTKDQREIQAEIEIINFAARSFFIQRQQRNARARAKQQISITADVGNEIPGKFGLRFFPSPLNSKFARTRVLEK